MICKSCGTQNSDKAKFCHGCGQKLESAETDMICKVCGKSIKKGVQFCKHCGSVVGNNENLESNSEPKPEEETKKRLCPSCGNEVKEGKMFCGACGTALAVQQKSNDDFIFDELYEKENANKAEEAGGAAEALRTDEPITFEEHPAKAGKVCANCGAPLKEGIKFCGQCGHTIDIEPQKENTKAPEATESQAVEAKSIDPWNIPAEELKMIKELYDDGILTKEEFEATKKKLLGL